MSNWIDPFTEVIYHFGDNWARKVRQHLAKLLSHRLSAIRDAKEGADVCAQFWQEYYSLVFPLRFGRDAKPLLGEGKEVELEPLCDRSLRETFLDAQNLPPLLCAETASVNNGWQELIADHHLVCAALGNVLLRAQGQGDTPLFHQVRLGLLAHELIEEVDLTAFPEAAQIARYLKHGAGDLPAGIDGAWLSTLHTGHVGSLLDEKNVALVGVGAQRIKQFVFESPGLNEIRGASTLLDDCVARLKHQVSQELGPEVVLRAAAATLEFLTTVSDSEAWLSRLHKEFLSQTGAAFVAAAALPTSAANLLRDYQNVLRDFHTSLERDRYLPDLPLTESLPFEVRCELCGRRAAENWRKDAENQLKPVCRVCNTKRELGRNESKGKSREVLDWLGCEYGNPAKLGVRATDFFPQDLGELTPDWAKRKRLAVIYGDGNNFGEVVSHLSSLALGLQWTHRVEKTTQAAVALALAHATKEASAAARRTLPKLPFQILALGGDDLSVLTWGRIGLRVCEQFLCLTDLELQSGSGPRLVNKPLAFSLGALFCDDKAPVRRTVDFAENELLKWAKRAARRSASQHGKLAFQLALTAEQIPPDLSVYRNEMYLCGNRAKLGLTMRPFTAKEIAFLLKKADKLRTQGKQGLLYNLVAAFLQNSCLTALLHYSYQKAREQGSAPQLPEGSFFALLEGRRKIEEEEPDWVPLFGWFPLVRIKEAKLPDTFPKWRELQPVARELFGEEPDDKTSKVTLLSPLWDLYEIIKILE